MQAGTIVGAVAYTTAGRSLVPYWKETEIRMEVAVVNPCPDEVAKLKAGGLSIETVDPKNAFSKSVGVSQIQGVPILFAYNARPDMPEDVVYKILVAFEQNKDKLASMDAGFGPMAKDFVGMQVNGINANPEIAVHRGPGQVPQGEEGLERQVEDRGRRDLIGGAPFEARTSEGRAHPRLDALLGVALKGRTGPASPVGIIIVSQGMAIDAHQEAIQSGER